MKRSLFLTGILSLFALVNYAQTKSLSADTILARTLRVSHSDSSREARVIMSSRTKDGRRELSYGKMWWTPDHFKMTFWDSVNTNYIESQIIEVYDTLKVYEGQIGTMHIYHENENPTGIVAGNVFFTGERNFNRPRLDGISQDSIAYLSLYPNIDAKFTVLKVQIDLRTYRTIEYTAVMKNGTISTLTFLYTKINEGIPGEVFIVRAQDYPEYTDFVDHPDE